VRISGHRRRERRFTGCFERCIDALLLRGIGKTQAELFALPAYFRRELGFELDEELDDEEEEDLTLFDGAGEEGVARSDGADGADGGEGEEGEEGDTRLGARLGAG
jgi:hypothetical protein